MTQTATMTDQTNSSHAKTFILTPDFQVDFTAYAPLHTFKGWTNKGVEARMDIDFENLTIAWAKATAQTRYFDTGDKLRNTAMASYIKFNKMPTACIEMSKLEEFSAIDDTRYRVSIQAVLEFMEIRRTLPLSFTLERINKGIKVDIAFDWSFKKYGLKAPQLLFLKVRDIVNIKGTGILKPSA